MTEESKKIGYVIAIIFLITSVWCMSVAYSVQTKFYGVNLEKKSLSI